MTAFIIDVRHSDKFIEIRKQYFPDGGYPCSALVTVAGFAKPGIMIEIQTVAVIESA
jgi:enamine deaminase RidA (YjgF/YER057c/UK114 family)